MFLCGEVVYLRSCYTQETCLEWDQLFIFGAAIISGKMCWCGCSVSCTKLLLSQESGVGVGFVVHVRRSYLQETCVAVAAAVHFQSCDYLTKYMLVWDELFIYGAAINSGNVCRCGSTGTISQLLLFQLIYVVVGAVNHSRKSYYLRKYKLMWFISGALIHRKHMFMCE
jgi:hypothetical protein